MTDKQQPEPLRIAALLEKTGAQGSLRDEAASELRRQHTELETLRAKLKTHEDLDGAADDVQLLRMGYAAARLEIESLKSQLAEHASHGQAPAPVLHLVNDAFAEVAVAYPKAFALHKVGIADTAVREALAAPAGAGMGHTDGGRNMFYEGRFDGESKRERQARLRWANDMRAAFERHTGNGWFDKDWRTETGLWSSAWHACLAAQPTTTAQAAPTYKDSTPELHIGDSAFESWYSTYSPAHKADKQRARDAYAAGMGDPLVTAAPAAVAGPSDDAVMDRTRDLASSGRWPSDWVDAYRRGYADAAPTPQQAPQQEAQEPFAWHVCSVNSDGSLSLEHAAAWKEAAHEHINDAITEHDIEGAGSWVVRPAYHAPQPSLAAQGDALEPVGWFDDDRVFWHEGKQPAQGSDLYTTPQPSPSAQAASSAVLKAIREANMQLVRTGDDAFMLVPYKVATAQAAESVPAGPRRKDMLWSTVKMQERYDQRIENIVSGLERIKQEHAGQQPQKIDECYGDCPTDSTTCTNPCRFDGRAARAPADSVLEDAARLERERICAAIKAEDDYCVDHGDYMLDSDDCIKIVRGEWKRPEFADDAARAAQEGKSHGEA